MSTLKGVSGISRVFDGSGGYFSLKNRVKDREEKDLLGMFSSGCSSASK